MIFSAGASSESTPDIRCGVGAGTVADVLVLPYNDAGAVERTRHEHADTIAAVVVEPICGNMGLCLPVPGFVEQLRELCTKSGALLVFDEVITGLRVAPGGAQERYGVTADLTCIGKTLGGGLPIAAFGGRADAMAVLAPDGGVFVGGTFSGNPACVAAAHALLDALANDPDLHARLERRAARLADGLRETMRAFGLGYPVVQCASMVDFMFRRGRPHRDMDEAKQADPGAYLRFYHKMLDAGVLLAPSPLELMFLTAAHSDEDIDQTIAAARDALA
jgi:glutamate-1-semialdehyde 2,1-aminomutase